MSDLASFSLINQKVEKALEDYSANSKGGAFMYFALQTIFKITDEELEDAITDGSVDGEVDAIYIDERVINILTFKYTDKYENSQKNYPESELDQFIQTIDLIISGNLDETTINTAVWEKYQEIRDLASSGKIEFKIHVVSNKEQPVERAKTKLSNCVDKYRIVERPTYYDQEKFVSIILADKTEKVNGNIQFIDKQHFEKSDGNIRTVIGAVAADNLITLIRSPSNQKEVNENIFNENIRVYKPRHRVNKEIKKSAESDDNYQFFYLNNGITILCETANYAPNTRSPLVQMENCQIINGGQTSHSLFQVHLNTPDKLDTIEVLVRICEAKKDTTLTEKISETSNNQIPVGSRDLHSNDTIQKKLEEEFLELGYFYERKPNQYTNEPKANILNNELLGQLYMAYHLEMPSEARDSKRKVFSENYDEIFDDMSVSAVELLRLHKLHIPLLQKKKDIQRKKRKMEAISEKEAFLSRATFHILNGTKYIFEFEEKKIRDSDVPEPVKKEKIESLYSDKADDVIRMATNLIFEVVEKQMGLRKDLYTHDKFFKEKPTNGIIKEHILRTISKT